MFKKRVAILLMTIAYGILFGHNVIPHHHDDDQDLIEHQSSHHHDAQCNPYSHFTHSPGGFTFIHSQSINSNFLKQSCQLTGWLSDKLLVEATATSFLLFSPPHCLIYSSPYPFSLGLRAPPVSIG